MNSKYTLVYDEKVFVDNKKLSLNTLSLNRNNLSHISVKYNLADDFVPWGILYNST